MPVTDDYYDSEEGDESGLSVEGSDEDIDDDFADSEEDFSYDSLSSMDDNEDF